jgi:hypothetical protein
MLHGCCPFSLQEFQQSTFPNFPLPLSSSDFLKNIERETSLPPEASAFNGTQPQCRQSPLRRRLIFLALLLSDLPISVS